MWPLVDLVIRTEEKIMADIVVEADTMDEETVQVFVNKLDMACTALSNPNQHIEGYGSGIDAAYQLLCEVQAIAPDNPAVAAEIASLHNIIDANKNGNNTPQEVNSGNTMAAESNTSNSPSMAEQVMQHWKTKPTIEILVCVTENNLKALADTIDSIAAQVYSNWKLTVVSNMPSPDPVFSQHDILQWIQTDNFQQSLDNVISESSSDWLGLIQSGSQLDSEALFSLANQDNLKGDSWQIIYSDEDHIDENRNFCQPIIKPDFDIEQFRSTNSHIGEFCFARVALLQQLGGIRIDTEFSNDDLILRAANRVGSTTIGHIPRILYHRPAMSSSNVQSQVELQSNVA